MSVGRRKSKAYTEVREDSLLEELRTEIDDHLHELTKDLASEGESAASLRARVDRRFGDVERVVRQCRWERRREIIVLRAVTVGLLIAIGVAAVAIFVREKRFESAVTKQLDAFDERVTAARPPAPMTARISGSVFLGEPEFPAAGARIFVCESPLRNTTQAVRLIHADANGQFKTGDLPLECYFLLVPLMDQNGRENNTGHVIQSRPLHLYNTGDEARVDLDGLAKSSLRVLVEGEVPETLNVNGRSVPVRLTIRFHGPGLSLPWPTDLDPPEGQKWPLVGRTEGRFSSQESEPLEYALTRSSETLPIPPGDCSMMVINLWAEDQPGRKQVAAAAVMKTVLSEGQGYQLRVKLPATLHASPQIDDSWRPMILQTEFKPADQIDQVSQATP